MRGLYEFPMVSLLLRYLQWLLCVGCFVFYSSYTCELYAQEKVTPIPDREIQIPMRDGVLLPANVYLPKESKTKKFSVVLIRHPIGKDKIDDMRWFSLVDAGYALVVQSTRSCCDETGKALPYLTDGWSDEHKLADGYDTVQWISTADFCDGTVSTIGLSATGITEFLLAPAAPPNLRCQYIEMAAPSLYQYAIYPGGQFKKEQVEGWLLLHRRNKSVTDWLKGRSRYDSFWSRFNALDYADQIRVPQLHRGGWYDIFLQGTIDAFFAAQQHSQSEVRSKHKLILGPWGHRYQYTGKLGEFSLEQNQMHPPVEISQCSWLDYHVRGIKNEVEKAPAVQYFVMGSFDGTKTKGNRWESSDSWPPQGAKYTRFYLSDEAFLKKTEGDMKNVEVFCDAKNPVPTIGGRNLFMPDGPRNIVQLRDRKDVCLFSTAELTEDLEVTGRLWVNLYIGTVDTERDVCVRLVDICPKGEYYLIAEGVAHVMPKLESDSGSDTPRLVIVDLWSTSMVFAKGHKIGLFVTASNFPAYDVAFKSSDEKGVAFSIHSTKKYPSSIALPIMQGG